GPTADSKKLTPGNTTSRRRYSPRVATVWRCALRSATSSGGSTTDSSCTTKTPIYPGGGGPADGRSNTSRPRDFGTFMRQAARNGHLGGGSTSNATGC